MASNESYGFEPFNIRLAWECPRCGIINAPHADYCKSCAPSMPLIIVRNYSLDEHCTCDQKGKTSATHVCSVHG